jgi:tRNA 2-selenouridine synthase
MPLPFTSLADLYAHGYDDVLDVRSPAEFAEDRIPGALSLPVLSNAQRAEVGTIYTQVSPFKARKIGAALVARNAAAHIEGPLASYDGAWRPLVYCWRGGQRSGSFASILSQIGWRAETIQGGYQSYRRLVVRLLHDQPLPHRVVLLDGNTGTAKTALLARVRALGGQVIDLEGLAQHRGSLFGSVAAPQPAQKGFESLLAAALTKLDPARPVLIEAESSKIGDLLIPPSLWKAMQAAPRLQLEAPLQARAAYLVRAYADLVEDGAALSETLAKLVPFQGHAQVAAWQDLAQTRAFPQLAAELMARHYDPRYSKGRRAHTGKTISLPDLSDASLDAAAEQLAAHLADNSEVS